ncbi:hypothetical protein Tco_0228829 [Tanacetum coccineum]
MSYEDIRPIFEIVWDQNNAFVPKDSEIEKEVMKRSGFDLQQKSSKKRSREDSDEDNAKKQKLKDDAKKKELRDSMDVVPRDDIAIDVESLATKYPIVDWKTHVLTKNMMYYQIIKADGSSKNYKIFSEMLDDFDRQDVLDLHRLVQERYDTTSPEGYDLLLWGDLKILFKPNEEDEIWKNQQDYNLISWRLFDTCGIHMLLMHTGIAIHMIIEKKYPLTQEMLSRMLSRRLEVDQESEMAFELLRLPEEVKDCIKIKTCEEEIKTCEEEIKTCLQDLVGINNSVSEGTTLEACLVTEGAILEAFLVTEGVALEACLVTKGITMDDNLVDKESTYDTTSSEQLDECNSSMEKKDTVSSCSDSIEQHMQQLQLQARS